MSVPIHQKLLLTASEVTLLTGIPTDEVYRLGAAGMLPRVKIGTRTRFPIRAIQEWIEDQTQGPSNGRAA